MMIESQYCLIQATLITSQFSLWEILFVLSKYLLLEHGYKKMHTNITVWIKGLQGFMHNNFQKIITEVA